MTQPASQGVKLIDATPADRFRALYITSNEICTRLGVSRATLLHARRNGHMPDGIPVNGKDIYIWERAQAEPYLQAWEAMRNAKAVRQQLSHATAAKAGHNA